MVSTQRFHEVVTTEAQLREVLGEPLKIAVEKVQSTLDPYSRRFIANSPFILLASSDASGHVDVSPKGDAPGFVQVLDDQTIAIPDRLGNKLGFGFRNILENPQVGTLFLIPGSGETLRINGPAQIVRDAELREGMAVKGKSPQFAIVVTVQESFLHCAKCIIRSDLWEPEQWPNLNDFPSFAQMIKGQRNPQESVEEIQRLLDHDYEHELY